MEIADRECRELKGHASLLLFHISCGEVSHSQGVTAAPLPNPRLQATLRNLWDTCWHLSLLKHPSDVLCWHIHNTNNHAWILQGKNLVGNMPAKVSLLWKVPVMKSSNSSSMREGLPRSRLLLQTLPSCHESPGSWCAHRAGDEAHTYLGVKCLLAKGEIPEQITCHLIHVAPTRCSSAWDSGSTAGKQEGTVREATTKNTNHVYP